MTLRDQMTPPVGVMHSTAAAGAVYVSKVPAELPVIARKPTKEELSVLPPSVRGLLDYAPKSLVKLLVEDSSRNPKEILERLRQ